jgi:pyrophosphate--fructose-6-phosphate 1-phosphotransferase
MSRRPSALEQARVAYQPRLPQIFGAGVEGMGFEEGETTTAARDQESIRERFPRTFGRPVVRLVPGQGPGQRRPLNAGVVLSGGQAPGGHNVIAGLFDALRRIDPASKLYGFLGGPKGIFTARQRELTPEVIDAYRNSGGFDLIGGGRDKIETPEQLDACRATCAELGLDGLVIVGGDDSNTNAAVLAEYFVQHDVRTAVVGVPKTIDGDMKGQGVESSFGFDTATKIYSELIGNICRDAKSAAKYWHFIKLMGRNASHVALECALQTHPNVTLIGEEVEQWNLTLRTIVERVADVVRQRALAGKNYGVCLVPEGLIEFIPEIRQLIVELNRILSENAKYLESIPLLSDRQEFVSQKLDRDSSWVFSGLPQRIRQQLLMERDAHGNVQVSRIDTEEMLVEMVTEKIAQWQVEGKFSGKLQVQHHFFGYEGRSAAPSNFDADYTYSLGHLATALIAFGKTGYICAVQNLAAPAAEWRAAGVPLTSMLQMETRKGQPTPVIGKALVQTDSEPFLSFAAERKRWAIEDDYVYPGAIQYFGPDEICCKPTRSLLLEAGRGDEAEL